MGDPPPASAVRTLGRYELLGELARGGMAEVHLAMQRGPGGFERLVVIKLIHEHLAKDPAFVEMLLEEGRLAGMIEHPNVIDIYDRGEVDGRHYVAMEYLAGESLLAILRHGAEHERLDALSTVRVIADTAEGLEAAHRLKSPEGKPLGLIHHDVSLGNIVVLYSGGVKLVDFGVAKARSRAGSAELVQGKLGYMAPEKLGEREVDRRADIWSLGVVAWEALTLQRLFKAPTDAETIQLVLEHDIPPPSTVNPDVPRELDPIILRALERDPEKRVSTAKGLALDLEAALRKLGYGGNNDRIAAYMERAFSARIRLHEQLIAELKAGPPSPATIAAFATAPAQPDAEAREGAPANPSYPDLTADLVEEDPSVARRRESMRDLQEWVDDERRWRALPWWQRNAPFLAGGAVLLLLVLVVVRCNTGGGTSPDAPIVALAPDADAIVPVEPPPVPVDTGPGAGSGIELGSDDTARPVEVVDEVVAPEPTPTPPPPPRPPPPTSKPRPAVTSRPGAKPTTPPKPPDRPAERPTTAEGLVRLGMDQLRRSDGAGAVTSFTQATKTNASYAPGWYGLGRAYEATGTRRGATKAAYQRYLSLAPTGQYAVDARARIEKL